MPIDDQEGTIVSIQERYSVLSRAHCLSQKQEQLIAANIDQVMITTSVVSPLLKNTLIDRYLIAAQKGNMAAVIVIDKIDLSMKIQNRKKMMDLLVKAYRKIKTPVVLVE